MATARKSAPLPTVTIHVLPWRPFGKRTAEDLFTLAELQATPHNVIWPDATPSRDKDAGKASFIRANEAADTIVLNAVQHIVKGGKVRVHVGTGRVCTADKDRGIYSNVIRPADLGAIMRRADVTIDAGSEDPRDYVAED